MTNSDYATYLRDARLEAERFRLSLRHALDEIVATPDGPGDDPTVKLEAVPLFWQLFDAAALMRDRLDVKIAANTDDPVPLAFLARNRNSAIQDEPHGVGDLLHVLPPAA